MGPAACALYVVMANGATMRTEALDYCSAECAAKHLGGAAKT